MILNNVYKGISVNNIKGCLQGYFVKWRLQSNWLNDDVNQRLLGWFFWKKILNFP